MLILDTDHVSLLEWQHGLEYERLRSRLDAVIDEKIATTIISYEEQTRGWLAYMARAKTLEQQVEAYRRMHRHLNAYCSISVLDFDESAAIQYQALRHLRRHIGAFDLRISAIAKSRNAVLLTRNTTDFSQVPGLAIEDWTRP
jgi:tRNA(fMet)-specific endonuclease VapC